MIYVGRSHVLTAIPIDRIDKMVGFCPSEECKNRTLHRNLHRDTAMQQVMLTSRICPSCHTKLLTMLDEHYDLSKEVVRVSPIDYSEITNADGVVIDYSMFRLRTTYRVSDGMLSATQFIMPGFLFDGKVGEYAENAFLSLAETRSALERTDEMYDIMLGILIAKGWQFTPVFGVFSTGIFYTQRPHTPEI